MARYDREWLKRELLENGKSLREVGEILGVSKQSVYQWCQKEKIFISKERKACWYARKMKVRELENPQWLLGKKSQGIVGIGVLARELKIHPSSLKKQIMRLKLDPKDFYYKASRVTVKCDFCGKSLIRPSYEVKRKQHNFCNRSHFGKWLVLHRHKEKLWTFSEKEFIKKHWREMSDKEMARFLPGRSSKAVKRYRVEIMKLKKR